MNKCQKHNRDFEEFCPLCHLEEQPPIRVQPVVSRRFPLMTSHPERFVCEQIPWLPWELLAPHNEQAKINHCGQDLEKLASRGGLSACEAVAILEDTRYRERWPKQIITPEERRERVIEANNRLWEIWNAASGAPGLDGGVQ